jgi:hypothetical protein
MWCEEVVVDRRLGQRLIVGAVAGAVGTAAMDLLLYRRYRSAGGDDSVWSWESAAGVTSWQQASAPGQIGRKLQRLLTRREPADRWARATTNTVHWATGIGWGIQYGAVIGVTTRLPWLTAAALGPAAWLAGYAVLPLVGVYQPIWKYGVHTLTDDLSAHLIYGAATSAAFAALSRRRRRA